MRKNKIFIVNSITASRIVTLVSILFIDSKNYLLFAAIWVALSDFWDGFLARKWDVITSFGSKFDQYADKIVSIFFLLFFLKQNQLGLAFIGLLILREILVIIFRHFNWSTAPSNFIGKAKTFFLYALFILLSSQHLVAPLAVDIKSILLVLVLSCSWLSFLLTIPSIEKGLVYFMGTTGLSAVLFKKAPGTISSFVSFALFFILLRSVDLEFKIGILLMLFIIHYAYFDQFLKHTQSKNDDPGIYTLDETLAIAVAWLFLGQLTPINLLLLFGLFRFFDIVKPLGIRSIEKQSNWTPALRNVGDDVLAMVYSGIVFEIIHPYLN
jgi:phosphatidylglycerophosphate synthase/phosphatidylglycerophosphatase A